MKGHVVAWGGCIVRRGREGREEGGVEVCEKEGREEGGGTLFGRQHASSHTSRCNDVRDREVVCSKCGV